jgi:hypothetical protein
MDDSKVDDASPFQKCILVALDRLYTKNIEGIKPIVANKLYMMITIRERGNLLNQLNNSCII